MGCKSKRVILSRLKRDLGQSGRGSGRVDYFFYMNFFFIREALIYKGLNLSSLCSIPSLKMK